MKAGARDTERLAQPFCGPDRSVLCDEAEPPTDSLAKEAAASWDIPLRVELAASRLSHLISRCSGFIWPDPGKDCAGSAVNSRPRLRNWFSCTLRSVATCATPTPRSRTSLTAPT
jgi:hypothetical protein